MLDVEKQSIKEDVEKGTMGKAPYGNKFNKYDSTIMPQDEMEVVSLTSNNYGGVQFQVRHIPSNEIYFYRFKDENNCKEMGWGWVLSNKRVDDMEPDTMVKNPADNTQDGQNKQKSVPNSGVEYVTHKNKRSYTMEQRVYIDEKTLLKEGWKWNEIKEYPTAVRAVVEMLNSMISTYPEMAPKKVHNISYDLKTYFNGDRNAYKNFVNMFGIFNGDTRPERLEMIRDKWLDYFESREVQNMMKEAKLRGKRFKEAFRGKNILTKGFARKLRQDKIFGRSKFADGSPNPMAVDKKKLKSMIASFIGVTLGYGANIASQAVNELSDSDWDIVIKNLRDLYMAESTVREGYEYDPSYHEERNSVTVYMTTDGEGGVVRFYSDYSVGMYDEPELVGMKSIKKREVDEVVKQFTNDRKAIQWFDEFMKEEEEFYDENYTYYLESFDTILNRAWDDEMSEEWYEPTDISKVRTRVVKTHTLHENII